MQGHSRDLHRSSTYNENSMINGSILTGGTYIMHAHRRPTKDGSLWLLKDKASPAAFHNSAHRFDAPKCHPNTRVAILKEIMDWVLSCDPATKDKLIIWLNGPAGAGKSAIAQSIAERCHTDGYLLASFFFQRSDPRRNNCRSLIATLTYQIHCNIPSIQHRIIAAIDSDPLIFERTLLTQLVTLIIEPLHDLIDSGYFANSSSRRVIVIDGVDECVDRQEQRDIIDTLFQSIHQNNSPILFLVASRREQDILAIFNTRTSLAFHTRLILDERMSPHRDIELFLIDEFKAITETHPLKHLIPEGWPNFDVISQLVRKSSDQFIYPATVVKYVKSVRHRPDHRLEVIQNLRPRAADSDMPFAELDLLYRHILSTVDDISSILHLFSFAMHHSYSLAVPVNELEILIGLEPGSLPLLVSNLGALMVIDDSINEIKVLHISLYDFLSDSTRSMEFYVATNTEYEISKHMRNCLLFFSNPHCIKYTLDGFLHGMEFFCCHTHHITLEKNIEELFDLSLVLELCQKLPQEWEQEHNMISLLKKQFLASIRQFLVRSWAPKRNTQLYIAFRNRLDATYLALMDPYFSERKLSIPLAVASYPEFFPAQALTKELQLLNIDFKEDDKYLSLLQDRTLELESTNPYMGPFLRNPSRSKQYCLSVSGSCLYANASLACFDFLRRLYEEKDSDIETSIPYIKSFEDFELNVINSDSTAPTQDKPDSDFVEHSTDCGGDLGNGMVDSPENSDDETNDPESAVEQEVDEMQMILDKEANDIESLITNDMIRWRFYWKDPFAEPDNTLYDEKFFRGKFPSYTFFLPARYYLMLGYMIFFLPRAGWSEELMRLCRETVLPNDPKMYPDHTASAQRAMNDYVERMTSTEEILYTLD